MKGNKTLYISDPRLAQTFDILAQDELELPEDTLIPVTIDPVMPFNARHDPHIDNAKDYTLSTSPLEITNPVKDVNNFTMDRIDYESLLEGTVVGDNIDKTKEYNH